MNTSEILRKRFGNVVEGPQGLKMPEAIARQIEEASKGLPKDFTYRRVAKAAADFRLEEGERADVSLITTDAVDRDGEIVLPKGGNWKNYNRVVTFAHRYDELPAGSNMWIKPADTKNGSGLLAKTRYPEKPADWGDAPWLPSAILHLMRQDPPTCTGKSIGFIPQNIRSATKRELEEHPEWEGRPVIDKWVGIEYAVAPVPCNPEAELQAVGKSGIDAPVAELILQTMKELTGIDLPPVPPLKAFVRDDVLKSAVMRRVTEQAKPIVKQTIRDAFERMLGRV